VNRVKRRHYQKDTQEIRGDFEEIKEKDVQGGSEQKMESGGGSSQGESSQELQSSDQEKKTLESNSTAMGSNGD